MSTTERVQNESRRSEGYRLLAALFYPPERNQLLADNTCLQLAEVIKDFIPDTAAACALTMQSQLQEVDETELRVDHAALFVGPFELKAPPYGSIYLEEARKVMGNSTLAVMDLYTEAGLQLNLREPADHITIELEFMHYLSALAAVALAAGDEDTAAELGRKQQRFLKDHLGRWAPAFCTAITKGADTLYFRALADCLRAFIGADNKFLNLEPAEVS